MNLVFLALLCIPVIEIAVLISVGGVLGLPLTVALVIGTAIIGTYLLRQQGLSLLFSAQQQVAAGQLPTGTVVEGVILAVGGALLLTPGFITDGIGFLCLFPLSRRAVVAAASQRIRVHGATFTQDSAGAETTRSSEDGVVLEGEYKKEP